MNQDEAHLKLLGTFHYVLGGVAAFYGCFPLFHLGVGLALLFGGLDAGDMPVFLPWFFIIFAAAFIFFSWTLAILIIVAGRNLQKRSSYVYCFVIAVAECILFMPLGTILGVFTIIALSKESVKALFGRPPVS